MQRAQRIVRFLSTDGRVYYGDAMLPPGVLDTRKAQFAKVISGDVLGQYQILGSVLPIRQLLSPLPAEKVRTVRCLGLNYRKHAIETSMAIPASPILFYKPSSALSGPTDPIPIPVAAQDNDGLGIDYECELVVVIGTPARDVSKENALDYVLGYSVGNDLSHRPLQLGPGGQWGSGKMFDGWAPFGPAIVSTDLIKDPQDLIISTEINGERFQHETTGDMIFSVQDAIAFLSRGTTLQPGDLIFMGTPPGVGMGRSPQYWLRDGDQVDISLSSVGSISNKVVYETVAPKL